MNWKVIMQNKEEISLEQEEYDKIIPFLNKVKLFRLLNGTVINAAYIMQIAQEQEVKQQIIPIERRIEAPIIQEEKRIKVLGGWQEPSVREKMRYWFNSLKASGSFKQFNSYENWEKAKYK